ncbi:hypothetical protein LBMAG42_40560 [Deltaproteobacteria bacterium]|nr:hypothetical protein LBMAG42_40560 [Deltaproteobacteria bacterium]
MRRALPIGFALVGSALFLWPGRLGLLGDPAGETHNHLWFFARSLLGLEANYPAGWEVPLMDPPNLPWFALGWLVSPTVAWNFVAVANVLLGCFGGWVLGKQVSGTAAGAFVGLAAVGWSPFLSGAIDFGVTEAYPLGFYALHVAMMERLRGAPKARGVAIVAGVTLACFALSGWYHAAFALVVSPLLAGRVRSPAVFLVGAIALLLVLPRFLQLLPHLGVWADRAAGLSDPTDIRAWQRQERYGIDALRFLPSLTTFTPSVSVYLGVALVGLSLLGGRASLPWLGMALPLYLLALGHWLRLGGHVVRLEEPLLMPAGWLVKFSQSARFITHWYRAAGPASVLLAAAAAVGAGRLARRLEHHRITPVLGPLLASLALADSLAFSSTRWPRVAAPLPAAPPLSIDGPVLDLPLDDNRTRPEVYGSRRPYWMWQLAHRQPVSENYEAADSVLRESGEARDIQAACGGLPEARPGASSSDEIAVGSDAVSLRSLGFRWIVVHTAVAPAGCAEAVGGRFGAPSLTVNGARAWQIEL